MSMTGNRRANLGWLRLLGLGLALTAPACATAQAPAAQAPSASTQVDIDAVERLVGDRELVVFGEDSHGMREVHELVPQVFRRLVEEKGFRLLVFESAWALDDGFKAFMASDRTTVEGDEAFFLNAFNSQPIVEMMIWIREWNRAHPNDPIRVAGYQPEQPVTDIAAIRAFADRYAPAKRAAVDAALEPCKAGETTYTTNIVFIGAMGARRRKENLPTYTADERAACLAGTAEAGRLLDGLGDKNARIELGLHLLSLKTYVGVLSRAADDNLSGELTQPANSLYEEGDRVRFEIFEGLRQTRYGDVKAFLWMHNWHGMKHADEVGMGDLKMPSLATRLAERHGADLMAIGHVVPCGTACAEPANSVETPFQKKFGDKAAVVDFSKPDQVHGLAVDKSGVLTPNFHVQYGLTGFTDVVMNRQFDGAIYQPSARPLR